MCEWEWISLLKCMFLLFSDCLIAICFTSFPLCYVVINHFIRFKLFVLCLFSCFLCFAFYVVCSLLCVVLLIVFVSFCVLFVCKCVLYYCHRVATQLPWTNISYYIMHCCPHHQRPNINSVIHRYLSASATDMRFIHGDQCECEHCAISADKKAIYCQAQELSMLQLVAEVDVPGWTAVQPCIMT
jgi:hypothetical protein